ncbi:glycerol-3-phosphate dehydrogenase/oxidase [Lysinibacillus sp. LZ02]|uniref:glycerol-3-phosphate dehydrogenase/oxidase n=1 Tax=Lysinibacillus sp. LZ02 TaxID=3420668 RepID=UPI003D368690
MSYASSLKRNEVLNLLKSKTFDVLIIGGGITGVGIALDAASRGLQVALIEMCDLASGTSSRSTKLVHGGLRYLKQFEIKEVADLGKERAIVYEIGPHVTTPVRMLLPFHKGGTFGKWSTSLGLQVYDFLAGVKKSERRKMLTVQDTLQNEPLIKKEGLLGGGMYVEYRTDDARLTIEVAKKAMEQGAMIATYTKVTDFLYDAHQKICGVVAHNTLANESLHIKAKVVINAAGPWVDTIRQLERQPLHKHLVQSKGVHIVFDASVFPLQQAVYFDTQDGRMVFAIPREGKTYVGTTDTFYAGDLSDIAIDQADRDYLMKAIRYMFPTLQITEGDIKSSWAGVRPLIHEEGKKPSEISRKDEIWASPSGLLTIAGGKLTGYRKMAEMIVDQVVTTITDKKLRPCVTKKLPISGGEVGGSKYFEQYVANKAKIGATYGLSLEESIKLARHYGSNVEQVYAYLQIEQSILPRPLYAQLHYGIEHELVVHPLDFFMRRTSHLFFDIDTVKTYREAILDEMQRILYWSAETRALYEKELHAEITRATTGK